MITSLNNPAVKRIRRLRLRREREHTGLFFVEGVRYVLAALEQGMDVETLIVAPRQWDSVNTLHDLRDRIITAHNPLRVAPEVLRWMTG